LQKYLITGFSGFVSKHFLDFLEKNEISASVLGLDLHLPSFGNKDFKHVKWSFQKIDLIDENSVENLIYEFQPEFILHLASFSSVLFSWKNPILSYQNNINIFLNLLEAVRKLNIQARIISVGSSEEYGNIDKNQLPLKEELPPNPVSPYAVARVSQEMLSKVYVDGFGMDIVMTRSFNHIGPGQKDIFAISSFARQIVGLKKNKSSKNEMKTGDISIVRDFIDVRDVVRAYYLLLQKGKNGEIYNICTGRGFSLSEIINKMAEIAGVNVIPRLDKRLIRPNDNKIIIGSNEKVKKDIGWDMKINLEKSLEDILEYWDNQ